MPTVTTLQAVELSRPPTETAETVTPATPVVPAAYVRSRTATGYHRTTVTVPWNRSTALGPR